MFTMGMPINAQPFIGKVVDKRDPAGGLRVKIRILGYHPMATIETAHPKAEKNIVDDEDLPWALCVNGTYGGSVALPNELDWVFGFFLDGRDAQHPIVIGTIPGMNLDDFGLINHPTTSVSAGDARTSVPSNVVPPDELRNDEAFQAKLDEMVAKYPGLTEQEVYNIIQGESGFDTTNVNPSTGATGLFQFMPATAAELGYSTADIQSMSASQQLQVYDEYLSRWDYSGSNSLGIMQAAPAYASASGGTVIYPVGSAAWRQNPGWRPSGGGDITVASINNYYNNQ